MPDNTPLSNQLNVDLSLRLNDPTTGADNGIKAAADGDVTKWTALQRNHYINSSIRWVGSELLKRVGSEGVYKVCPGLIATQNFIFSSSGIVVNLDYMEALWLFKAGGLPFTRSTKMLLDLDQDRQVSRAYAIDSVPDAPAAIYAYERVVGILTALNSGSGVLYYVKADRKNTQGVDVPANTPPDTTLDQKWHNAVLTYASGMAYYDKGIESSHQETVAQGISYMKLAEGMLPNVQS